MSTITNNLMAQEWTTLYETFKTKKNPDTDVLQRFLDAKYTKKSTTPDRDAYHYAYMRALRVKLEALTQEPSPIEKTMTRSQLYLTDSPLWALDMIPRDIIEIVDAVAWLKRYGTERQILNMFDDIIDFNGKVNYPRLNDIYR
jgi:hypothetical protein